MQHLAGGSFPPSDRRVLGRTAVSGTLYSLADRAVVVVFAGPDEVRDPELHRAAGIAPEPLQLIPAGQTVVCDHMPQSVTERTEPASAARTERDLFQTVNQEHLPAAVIAHRVARERDHGGIHLARTHLQTIRRGQILKKNKSPGRGRGNRRVRDPPEIILRPCEPKRKSRSRRLRTLSRSQSERVQRSPWLQIPRVFSLRQNRPCPR